MKTRLSSLFKLGSLNSTIYPRGPSPIVSTKAFNTLIGKTESLPQHALSKVVRQSSDAAFYLMQMVQLRSAQVLTFYDSGANGNLVHGQLAESIGLHVLDSTPATVTVVGGGGWFDLHQVRNLLLHPGP
jgi:hypothetical protein